MNRSNFITPSDSLNPANPTLRRGVGLRLQSKHIGLAIQVEFLTGLIIGTTDRPTVIREKTIIRGIKRNLTLPLSETDTDDEFGAIGIRN